MSQNSQWLRPDLVMKSHEMMPDLIANQTIPVTVKSLLLTLTLILHPISYIKLGISAEINSLLTPIARLAVGVYARKQGRTYLVLVEGMRRERSSSRTR